MAREIKINRAVQALEQNLEHALEHALDSALRPVGPRPEYLDHLRHRLMEEPDRADDDEQLVRATLAGLGVFSVILLILASVKLVQNRRRGRTLIP